MFANNIKEKFRATWKINRCFYQFLSMHPCIWERILVKGYFMNILIIGLQTLICWNEELIHNLYVHLNYSLYNIMSIVLNSFNDQEHWFNQSWYSLNFGTNQITFIRSASTQMSVNLFMIWFEHYHWLCYLFFIRYYIDYNWLCYLFFIRNYNIFLYFGKSLQITDKYALGMSGKSRFCLLGKQLLCLRHIFTESIHHRL